MVRLGTIYIFLCEGFWKHDLIGEEISIQWTLFQFINSN